jgi:4-hydroxybenzoate polyprenyltransferase
VNIFTPTFRLLTVSLPVAISGAFRLYIACLFLGVEGDVSLYIAFALLVYATYTLDRTLGCEEDRINRSELEGTKKEMPILLCIISFLSAAFILSRHALEKIVLLPAAIGYLYSRGIKLGGFVIKLKGSYGAKNLVVGITWGALIAGIMRTWSSNLTSLLSIFSFFSMKVFINSVIYDFRDIRGDTEAGIKTLPVMLGEKKTKTVLLTLHLILHLAFLSAVLLGYIRFEPVILLYSFIAGVVCISFYLETGTNEKKRRRLIREFLIDGESASAVALRKFTEPLFLRSASCNS